ncbi:DUF5689 domain-containing protein [Flagellimonas algicola]|uniref:Lamin tail domain-containing protein n=1 Tax=Flagellimonas algicola TaxID=2583815 RepID=A0ABY2WL15_9FLAO|nr:DUF5689 domain-containing protein [Allomuricauda algicola]TMU55320.1 lamin tail domain-containing protein [Allomuricauda algicola]
MKIKVNVVLKGWILSAIISACVPNTNFDVPKPYCDNVLSANTTFQELEGMYSGETFQIQEDLIIEGYVISSDEEGNFYNEIYLQDKTKEPTKGLLLEAELSPAHLRYPLGNKVLIKLKGLFLGISGETLRLGSSFTSFGNLSVGRLPAIKVQDHLVSVCEEGGLVTPTLTTITQMDQVGLNTLIQLNDVEFGEEELGLNYAEPQEETIRVLQDCEENRIELLTSGYSDFQAELLPEGNGSIMGILKRDGEKYQLVIRDVTDLDFANERCPEIITEFTSKDVFISELADPDNNTGARFVELYNSSNQPLDLNLWTLRRYTNEKTEVSSSVDLSGFSIAAKGTLVISPNSEEFELVYGFPPDIHVSTNSPADSNGDDNLELVDPFGTIIDVFGVVGEDGSGTNHEFEDGRALRNLEVTQGNPTYTFGEWFIYNDSGDAGTTHQLQNAPEDYTPGQFN